MEMLFEIVLDTMQDVPVILDMQRKALLTSILTEKSERI